MNTASSSSSKYSNESDCHSHDNYSYHPSSGYEDSSHRDTLAPKFDVYFQEYLGYVNKFMFKLPQDDFKGCWDNMDPKYIHPDTMKDINRIMINQMENYVNLSEKLNDCQTIIRRLDSIRASSSNKPRFCVWANEDKDDHLRKDLLLRRTIKDMLHEVEDIENKSSEYIDKLIEDNKYLKQRLDKCDYYQNNLLDEIETLKAIIKEYKLSNSSIVSLCRYSLQEYNNKINQYHSEHDKVQEIINYWYNRDFPGNGCELEISQISDCCSTDSINVHVPSTDVVERNNDISNNISSIDEWSQVDTP